MSSDAPCETDLRIAALEREVLTLKEQQRTVNGAMMDLIAKVARLKNELDFVQLAKAILDAVEARRQ